MNIDSILIDLEIIGQVKENDKLAVSNIVGATKLLLINIAILIVYIDVIMALIDLTALTI